MHRKKNIAILEDTLVILKRGSYSRDGQNVQLTFSPEQMREIQVFLPEGLTLLTAAEKEEPQTQSSSCTFAYENEDALVLAQKQYQRPKNSGDPVPKFSC